MRSCSLDHFYRWLSRPLFPTVRINLGMRRVIAHAWQRFARCLLPFNLLPNPFNMFPEVGNFSSYDIWPTFVMPNGRGQVVGRWIILGKRNRCSHYYYREEGCQIQAFPTHQNTPL